MAGHGSQTYQSRSLLRRRAGSPPRRRSSRSGQGTRDARRRPARARRARSCGSETSRPPAVCGSNASATCAVGRAVDRHGRAGEVAVAAVAAGADARGGELERARERGQRGGVELDRDAAPLGELVGVTEKAEARDVGDRVRGERAQRIGGAGVQHLHPPCRLGEMRGVGAAFLLPVHEQAGAERLRQVEDVARLRAGLRPDRIGRHGADDGEAVLRLLLAERVPAGEQAAGLRHLRRRRRRGSPRPRRAAATPGNAAIESASSGRPPIANTSLSAFAAAIAPNVAGSSTIGGKKSSVKTSARSSSSR